MNYQSVFKRYEIKYILSPAQKQSILSAMEGRMKLDDYGRSTIQNIYYDSDDYRLIRRSIEKPVYKEKLRTRSYGRADKNGKIFVELKKKYEGVVYKRRISLDESTADNWLCGSAENPVGNQISNEIDYFAHFYDIRPRVFISYEREAYFSTNSEDLRVTFDENILYRTEDLSLSSEAYGTRIFPEDMTLMEIKTPGGIPLWLTAVLNTNNINKCSFSKYGTAYQNHILPGIRNKI